MVRGAANYGLAHIIAQKFYAVSMPRRERDGRSGDYGGWGVMCPYAVPARFD